LFYDALIVASALEARCRDLASEDVRHGRMFGTLQVRNPVPLTGSGLQRALRGAMVEFGR
jgi:predicted nucleic acid-binding protein